MTDEIESGLDGISAVLVGAFIITVSFNGNAQRAIDLLKQEIGFLEFLVAVFLIKLILEKDKTGIFYPFAGLAAVAAALNLAGKAGFLENLEKFGMGKTGLFETIVNLTKPGK